MFDLNSLAGLASSGDHGDAVMEAGAELVRSEYRIDQALGNIRRSADDIQRNLDAGREVDSIYGLQGSDVAVLFTSLGERNALIRTMRRLGVDPTQF